LLGGTKGARLVGSETSSAAFADGGRQSKADRVYLSLKQAIVSGALPPDALIDKIELSTRFQVSRLSVTAAVNRLAFERLVVVEPQRGSYVAKIRLDDARQWMLIRRALEMEVVATCARELPEAAIERLARNIAYQRTALDAGDMQGFHELDTVLHLQLVDGLGWGRVTEVLEPVRTHLERVRRTLLPEPGRMNRTFAEHQEIYRAIAAREPDAASKAMGHHLNQVLHELEMFVARHPGFFET
jgi:GntR family transcriptional regulator, rspAB operon transcriptional repressor